MNGAESLVRKCRPVVVGADRHQHAATTHIFGEDHPDSAACRFQVFSASIATAL